MARQEQSSAARRAGRERHLWARFRLTAGQWEAMYRAQEGRCMYCRQRGDDLGGRAPMVPDHSHDPADRRVRGLGHGRCNRVAGLVEAALASPPAFGVVDHQVPVAQFAAMAAKAERDRARRRSPRPARSGPGERQTYRYPTSGETDIVASALQEVR